MPEEKEWTVMVILAGDNNLSEEMLFALKEMKLAGANPEVNVLALFDSNEPGVPTQAYVLNSSPGSPPKTGLLLNEVDAGKEAFPALSKEFNAGDPTEIANFIHQGFKQFPARHYMVVFSGHNTAGDAGFLLTDEHPVSELTLAELKTVFELAKVGLVAGQPGVKQKIDILGMDSCLISSAEVCYQLRDHVDFVVGPQGFEPNLGWPYRQALGVLLDNPLIAARDLATRIVDEYVRYYYDYTLAGRSVDLAACNLQHADALATAVNELVTELLKALPAEPSPMVQHPDVNNPILNAIILAHWDAQGFKFDQFTDLYDFCDRLEQRCYVADERAEKLRDACNEVKRVLTGGDADTRFIVKSCTSGPAFQHSHGLSIYLPWALEPPLAYTRLDFSRDAEWQFFIKRYVANSRRSPLPGVSKPPFSFDSPTKSKGPDKPGTMKNSPLSWELSQCLHDLTRPATVESSGEKTGGGGETK
ncbi:MAG: hypothetical protein QOG00_3514 [Pyrinomonadaceae bacterium]|nr:hypothetical protein [Pyrinomonadaceae bacterium]